MEEKKDLFADLCALVGCENISDLYIPLYHSRAVRIFLMLRNAGYPKKQLEDMENYLQ